MNKIILLIPLFLLTACNGARLCDTNAKSGPTFCGNRTASPQEAKSGATVSGRADVRNTPENAVLMGENSALATPDAAGTMAVLSMQLTQQAANDARVMSDRTATQQAVVNGYAAATQTAAAPERTAINAAQGTQSALIVIHATELSIHATQTSEYPAIISRAAKAKADADFAPWLSASAAIAGIITPLAILLAVGLMGWAMVRPHVISVLNHTDDVTRPSVPKLSGGTCDRPLPVDPATMYRFLSYAVTASPLGAESMERSKCWGSSPAERKRRNEIIYYLSDCEHIADDIKLVLLPHAIAYWRGWMAKYSPAPTTPPAKSAVNTLHGNHVTGDFSGGEVGEGGTNGD